MYSLICRTSSSHYRPRILTDLTPSVSDSMVLTRRVDGNYTLFSFDCSEMGGISVSVLDYPYSVDTIIKE